MEEDNPNNYKHAVYVMTMKLFADMERKKRSLEQRDMEERKRKREEEIEAEEKATMEKEWQKNFEVCDYSRSIFFFFFECNENFCLDSFLYYLRGPSYRWKLQMIFFFFCYAICV